MKARTLGLLIVAIALVVAFVGQSRPDAEASTPPISSLQRSPR